MTYIPGNIDSPETATAAFGVAAMDSANGDVLRDAKDALSAMEAAQRAAAEAQGQLGALGEQKQGILTYKLELVGQKSALNERRASIQSQMNGLDPESPEYKALDNQLKTIDAELKTVNSRLSGVDKQLLKLGIDQVRYQIIINTETAKAEAQWRVIQDIAAAMDISPERLIEQITREL